jgi:hypothetical protein
MDPITLFVPMFTDFTEEGRDAENHWYDTDHVPQRLTIPGFLDAARFERLSVVPARAQPAPLRYLNTYRLAGPEVVGSDAYSRSFQHETPRTGRETFTEAIPAFRDVWSTVGGVRGKLRTADGVRTVLLTADEPTASTEAAITFLDRHVIPTLLSCPGVLQAFLFQRVDTEVALATSTHAPRLLTAYVLSSAETVTRSEYASADDCVTQLDHREGDPVQRVWSGVYDRRPSPWTTAPAR